jgi:hypothetical protein
VRVAGDILYFYDLLAYIRLIACRHARKARIDAPGAVHPIIVRGIERGKVLRSDSNRADFMGTPVEPAFCA